MSSSFLMSNALTELNTSTVKWNVKVRAQAVWRGINRETKEFRGINVLFVDDSKCRIHAFVNARYAPLFEKELEEGQIYNISNFMVQEYTGLEFHRCVRYDKHIYFADYTKLEKIKKNDLKIPACAFDLFNLEDLEAMSSDKRFLCDLVGVVINEMPLKEYMNDDKQNKIQKSFSVTNGRCSIKVTFFDKLAESIEEALRKLLEQKVVIIIASAKIGTFQGEINITNYPATRFYVNFDHKAVKELMTREISPTSATYMSTNTELLEEIMSVAEIKKLKEDYIKKRVVCNVTVKKVEESLHWYDNVCAKCAKPLLKEDGRFKCDKCNRFFTWPPRRFRVCILCFDSTGGIPIILGDREVRRLTGKTVFDIQLDQAAEEDEDKFPTILQSFQNKQYQITINITEENVQKISDVYEACHVQIDDEKALLQKKEMQAISEEAEDDIETVALGTQTEIETPGTVTSAIKTRVRKSPDADKHNNNNIVKNKIRAVKIKQEKAISKDKVKNRKSKKKTDTSSVNLSEIYDLESDDEDETMCLKSLQEKTKKEKKQIM